MFTLLVVIAAAAWVGAGNHAVHRHVRKARQVDPEWEDGRMNAGDWIGISVLFSFAGPFTYLISRAEVAKRMQMVGRRESLPGQLETEKRLLEDLRGVRRCLAIQAEKIAAAKALSDGTAGPGQAHTAPLSVGDMESACDLWQELKEKESALEASLTATREQVTWLKGMYEGIIEANQIPEAELQEAVKLLPASAEAAPPTAEAPQIPAPSPHLQAPPDEDAVMLAKLGDPGLEVHRRLISSKAKNRLYFYRGRFESGSACPDNVPELAMGSLDGFRQANFIAARGRIGGWINTEFGDYRLGFAVGNAGSAPEAKRLIEWRLKQAIAALERSETAMTAAPPLVDGSAQDEDWTRPSGTD